MSRNKYILVSIIAFTIICIETPSHAGWLDKGKEMLESVKKSSGKKGLSTGEIGKKK